MRSKKPWILIVEDDPGDRQLIAEAFNDIRSPLALDFIDDSNKLQGFLVYCLRTYRSSFQLPELIILDFYLPHGNALYVLDDLNNDERFKNIPVIVISGKASQQSLNECKDKGAIRCLIKPKDYAGLLNLAQDLDDWLRSTDEDTLYRPQLKCDDLKRTSILN